MIEWILLLALLLLPAYLFSQRKVIKHPTVNKITSSKLDFSKLENLGSYPVPQLSTHSPSCFTYVRTPEELETSLAKIKTHKCIGLDIEEHRYRSYVGFICLMQITTPSETYLVDTLELGNSVLSLKEVFEDPSIVKVMHGCANDLQWLKRDFGIFCVNVYDTQIACRLLGHLKLGLNHIWHELCGFSMSSKEKARLQKSDWRVRPLSKDQLSYAAIDSFYLTQIMHQTLQRLSLEDLAKMRTETNELTLKEYKKKEVTLEECDKAYKKHSREAYSTQSQFILHELFLLRDQVAKNHNESWSYVCPVQSLVDIANEKPQNTKTLKEIFTKEYLLLKYKQEILGIVRKSSKVEFRFIYQKPKNKTNNKKKQRYLNFINKFTIKKKVYENCQILAPDNEILCYTNKKKANWYLERNLAQLIQEEPLVVKLNFEPSGRGFSDVEADQKFYHKEKKNKCVVCGAKKNYLKYHVVPMLYRQAFPEEYKSHRSHDVVLLCPVCHEKANKHSDRLKKQIAEEYEEPLNQFSEMQVVKDKVFTAQKQCSSLLKHGEKMPTERYSELVSKLQNFIDEQESYQNLLKEQVGSDQVNQEVIKYIEQNSQKLLSLHGKYNWKKKGNCVHGENVIKKVSNLKEFIRRWRVHFIETMNPQHLAEAWSVDHLMYSNSKLN